ncbi:dockerin type I domain-containing protein [Novispirillum itersonii]|uniref:EF-hand domain-containing protein n=1 Tax=Novispirillum itersonii TaxID=189 RepID=A0A7W9ZGV0_NOVIT|nr:dockerin type I domain-containing protein [Novispirillum itersonii]MBB6211256.1 hypothetical protein [Novispirillum itersonii]
MTRLTPMVFLAALAAAAVHTGPALAQELPSSLQVVGVVSPDVAQVLSLAGAVVSVIDRDNGSTVGTGAVIDANGTFFVEMMQSNSFNGRVMQLSMTWQGKTYGLYEGTRLSEFPFAGSFPFPSRVNKTVTVRLPGQAEPPVPGGGLSPWDVNRDGVFNEKDIEQLYNGLGGQAGSGPVVIQVYDVNRDGVFNSLDIVDARRALQGK